MYKKSQTICEAAEATENGGLLCNFAAARRVPTAAHTMHTYSKDVLEMPNERDLELLLRTPCSVSPTASRLPSQASNAT
eukprot:IDg12057t1